MNSVDEISESSLDPSGGEEFRSHGYQGLLCCHSSSCFVLSDGIIRAIFLVLGVGILIPWNAFVSAEQYFASRLCESGDDVINFEQWFGLVWNLSSVVSLGLIIVGQTISGYCKMGNEHPLMASNVIENTDYANQSADNMDLATDSRLETISNPLDSILTNESGIIEGSNSNSFYTVMVPLVLYMMVFSVQALLVTIPDIPPTTFLLILFSGLALCGTCGAIATSGIVSTAADFPSHLGINPFFSGQALGGAVVATANFVAITTGEDPNDYLETHCGTSVSHNNEFMLDTQVMGLSLATKHRLNSVFDGACSPYENLDWAVLSYFLAGCLVLFLCLLGYQKILQYQSIRNHHVYETVQDHHSNQDDTNIINRSSGNEVNDVSPRIGPQLNDRVHQRPRTLSIDDENVENEIERGESYDEREDHADADGPDSVLPVITGPATCVFLTFTITLCLFPSWISKLKSSHECENRFRLDNDLYVPFSFVFFNIGDLLGRLLAEYIPVNRIRHLSRKLVTCSFLRILFLPLFLMCNTMVGQDSNIVVRNDFFSLLIQLLFSVSNGVLISTSFMWSPQLVGDTSTLQERASEVMTFSVSFGLLCGSFLAFPFLRFASHMLK